MGKFPVAGELFLEPFGTIYTKANRQIPALRKQTSVLSTASLLILFLPAYFLTAGLLMCGINWLNLISWRRLAGAHWTERARELHPIRMAAFWNKWLIPANLVCIGILLISELKSWWPAFAISAWIGANLGNYPMCKEIYPWFKFKDFIRQLTFSWMLRFPSWSVLLIAFWTMPDQFNWQVWVIAGVATAIQVWMVASGFGLRLARWLRVLKPAPQRLQSICAETSQRTGIHFHKVWLVDTALSYAAASPTTRDLIFSERLVELHPDDEVMAVCAHELAHLTEPRAVRLRRIASTFFLFPWIFFTPVMQIFPENGLLLLFIASGCFLLMNRGLSRRMEVRADKFAAEHQTESGIYARALERLYRSSQIPAVMSGRQTHPNLYDRLIAAGITPDFPKPAPPFYMHLSTLIFLLVAILLLGITLGQTL